MMTLTIRTVERPPRQPGIMLPLETLPLRNPRSGKWPRSPWEPPRRLWEEVRVSSLWVRRHRCLPFLGSLGYQVRQHLYQGSRGRAAAIARRQACPPLPEQRKLHPLPAARRLRLRRLRARSSRWRLRTTFRSVLRSAVRSQSSSKCFPPLPPYLLRSRSGAAGSAVRCTRPVRPSPDSCARCGCSLLELRNQGIGRLDEGEVLLELPARLQNQRIQITVSSGASARFRAACAVISAPKGPATSAEKAWESAGRGASDLPAHGALRARGAGRR